MVENIVYCLNAVLPLVALMFLGYMLRKFDAFGAGFWNSADKLVFNLALPVFIFNEMQAVETSELFNVKLIIFTVSGVIFVFVSLLLTVPHFIKDHAARGAFIQGIYRGNSAILGVPLAANLAGAEGAASAALILPFTIPLFNIFAVLVLSLYSGGAKADSNITRLQSMKKILLGIILNPLIIAITIAIPFMFLDIIPAFLQKTLTNVANLSTPLALLSLGAGINFSDIKSRLSLSLPATLLRIVVFPAIATVTALICGFTGASLAALFVLFAAPTAVSSYIMSKNMGGDHKLSADIIALTTIFCPVTIFAGSFILKQLGYL